MSVSMVTSRTEIDIGTVNTLPPNTSQRRAAATVTHHTIMPHSCEGGERREEDVREGVRGGRGRREEGGGCEGGGRRG